MTLTTIVEIFIALTLTYFLLSTISTALVEYFWHQLRFTRNKDLKTNLGKVLGDQLYAHQQLKSTFSENKRLGNPSPGPSYISDETFASVLVDIANQQGVATADSYTNYKTVLTTVPINQLFQASSELLNSFASNSTDLASLKANIKTWYNSHMDREGGSFKRETKRRLFGVSLILVLILNVNTLSIVSYYKDNPENLARITKIAGGVAVDPSFVPPSSDSVDMVKSYQSGLQSLMTLENSGLPIFWKSEVEMREIQNKDIKRAIDSLSLKGVSQSLKESFWLKRSEYDDCANDQSKTVKKQVYKLFQCNCAKAIKLKNMDDMLAYCGPGYFEYYKLLDSKVRDYQKVLRTEANIGERFKFNVIDWQGAYPSKGFPTGLGHFLVLLIGIVITAFACSRGATFWFDLLNRFVNARNSGLKPIPKTDK